MTFNKLHASYCLASVIALAAIGISLWPKTGTVQQPYSECSNYFWRNAINTPCIALVRDDYPELLPVPGIDSEEILMTVEESVHYQIEGEDGRYDWASIEPAGWAYVRLGPDRRAFAYVMGHELHCLHRIRISIAEPDNPLGSLNHARHCLNYLRQWILCTPDLTLEPFDPLERDFETERVGATHVCQNWKALYEFAADNFDQWREFNNQTSSSS